MHTCAPSRCNTETMRVEMRPTSPSKFISFHFSSRHHDWHAHVHRAAAQHAYICHSHVYSKQHAQNTVGNHNAAAAMTSLCDIDVYKELFSFDIVNLTRSASDCYCGVNALTTHSYMYSCYMYSSATSHRDMMATSWL